MIKKIIFTLVLSFLVFSCGKKGDPKYKDANKKIRMQSILISKI